MKFVRPIFLCGFKRPLRGDEYRVFGCAKCNEACLKFKQYLLHNVRAVVQFHPSPIEERGL